MIRPLPDSLVEVFGQKLECQNWGNLDPTFDINTLVNNFQETLAQMFTDTFPEKKIVINPRDEPWFNERLRLLKRQRQRLYEKFGKTEKYLKCKDHFDNLAKLEVAKYREKIVTEVKEGKRGSSYASLRKLGMRPGEVKQSGFVLSNYLEENLSNLECVERIADFFSEVSQEYSPLCLDNLPPNVQEYLGNPGPGPVLSHYDVYQKLLKAKKPNSVVPDDLPRKLIQQFPGKLAIPVSTVYNKITQSQVYPSEWKVEHQLPIPKVTPPVSEDDLRNLSKTPFQSKVYESCLADWLLPIIQPYLDPGQCGSKGLSITHYLIKLLNFTHAILDKKQPFAVLAACIDLSKAFNRVSHNLLVQDLHDMHTPAWLLNILISYLSNRTMVMSYNGETSTPKELPGGGPQGA